MLHGREFRSRKKGGLGVGKTKRGKGTKWMVVVERQGIPVGGKLASASEAEVNLAERTLQAVVADDEHGRPQRPLWLIADKGYDSDRLRERLLDQEIILVCSHRRRRRKAPFNDGRHLRRYRKRWIVERSIAWLGNYRRLLVRHERRLNIYCAFFYLACAMIALRRITK